MEVSPVQCRMFSHILDLYLLHVRYTMGGNKKYFLVECVCVWNQTPLKAMVLYGQAFNNNK